MRGSSFVLLAVVGEATVVVVGVLVAAGALVAAGVVVVGVVDAAFFFVVFVGVVGAASGSWYCWSPAPSAKAAAGASASANAAASEVRARRDIEPLVADVHCDPMVRLPAWPRHAVWR